jgi:hypothetical protein
VRERQRWEQGKRESKNGNSNGHQFLLSNWKTRLTQS